MQDTPTPSALNGNPVTQWGDWLAPVARPMGVTPLIWREFIDENQNTQRDALSHVAFSADETEAQYWHIMPCVRDDRLKWRVSSSHPDLEEALSGGVPNVLRGTGTYLFDSPEAAQGHCEAAEVALGGAERAPRAPTEADDEPPAVTDAYGFAPTRQIKARWSRKGGTLYLSRVWAKPENPDFTQERELVGEEFEAALPVFLTQKLVQTLVATITRPEGIIVPFTLEADAIGCMRLECSVHFAECTGLFWERPARYAKRLKDEQLQSQPINANWDELPVPTHSLIASIVGEHLIGQRKEFETKMANTTEDKLRREIAKSAKALGIPVEAPRMDTEGGNILPATLEDMQRGGVDLEGKSLR